MTNSDIILELLDDIQPRKYCDDCLSNELMIQPRQQVNQICRGLKSQGKIVRQRAHCDSCQKQKITNSLIVAPTSSPARALRESQSEYVTMPNISTVTDVEHIRTQVVRICRQIWSKRKSEDAPRSISALINMLKNESLLPSRQANMMLTLCNLRNAYVYENVEMSNRELIIASNAWSIVSDWWNRNNR